MERFSEWLLQELKTRGLTQSDLARSAKLGSGTLSNIMSGNRKVGQDTLAKIAFALRIPPEVVFRAAGLLPPHSDDPWVEKQTHRLSQIDDPTLREIANNFILSMVEQEDAKRKNKKLKLQTVLKDK
jgi:transcriptional regulator with XRE-family HTH domain